MPTPPPADLVQLHLNAKGCSGHAVRLRKLSFADVDRVIAEAAKGLTPDATMIELARREQRNGAEAMLAEVTAEPVAEGALAAARFVPFNLDASTLSPKDWGVLMRIYAREYNPSQDEVDAIVGKAVAVSAG